LVPPVPRKDLVAEARSLLSKGLVSDYERLVHVFRPQRPLVTVAECRKLIHDAAIDSLESGRVGVFCEVAVSPLCDRATLLTPRVKALAQRFLAAAHSFHVKLRLEMALRGERYQA
jgi:hypothetical protein